jgi:hypothetical protein
MYIPDIRQIPHNRRSWVLDELGPAQDLAGPVELAQLTEGVGEVGQQPTPAAVALGVQRRSP